MDARPKDGSCQPISGFVYYPPMSQRIDLTGQRFGRLVAVRDIGGYRKARKNGRTETVRVWECSCLCGSGKKVQVTTNALRFGRVRSCRCLLRETSERLMTRIVRQQKRRAAEKYASISASGVRQCSKCMALLPLSAFHNNRSRPIGKMGTCRQCHNAGITRRYREATKTVRTGNNAARRRGIVLLRDWYLVDCIRAKLRKVCGIRIPSITIPKELIDARREVLRVKRLLKETRNDPYERAAKR